MSDRGGMSPIVQSVSRKVAPFILAFGLYIVIYGHLTPGGGFQGGVIIAAAFILLVLALGRRAALAVFSEDRAHLLDSLGAFAFLALAAFGYFFLVDRGRGVDPAAPAAFFGNFLGRGGEFHLVSSGTILLANLFIAIKVGACLFAAFVALAAFGRSPFPDGKEKGR